MVTGLFSFDLKYIHSYKHIYWWFLIDMDLMYNKVDLVFKEYDS